MSDLMLTEILAELKRTNELLLEQARNTQLMARWEADGVLRQLLKEPRYGFARRLEHYAHKVFSENGEDGMIQEIFRRIGTTNKRFVEFGVSGGIECNTHLLLHFGWSGLWIEAQESWAQFIGRVFAGAIADGRLTLRNDRVTKDNINDILPSAGLHGEIDLLSVDIDGDDYFVCDALTAVSPRVIVVEYNASFPPPMKYLNQMSRPDGLCFGASLAAMADMLFHKGYSLVGTDVCGVNAFFVRRDLVEDRFVQVDEIAALYNPPRYGLSMGAPRGHYPPVGWNPGYDIEGHGSGGEPR